MKPNQIVTIYPHMKILIAYDGSGNALTAINDLQNAGMPAKAEVLILCVSEIYLSPIDKKVVKAIDEDVEYFFQEHQKQIVRNLIEAERLATEAKEKLEKYFPKWTVITRIVSGSPTQQILSVASKFDPDMIILGAQGLSWDKEVKLGNVGQIILTESKCSIRVTKAKFNNSSHLKIAVCFDNSRDSIKAIETISMRNWKEKPEVRIFIVLDFINRLIPGRVFQIINDLPEGRLNGEQKWVESLADGALITLRNAGFSVSLEIYSGNPRMILANKIKDWNADLIFTGAKSHKSNFFSLGSVALAVATQANCSVEVIR